MTKTTDHYDACWCTYWTETLCVLERTLGSLAGFEGPVPCLGLQAANWLGLEGCVTCGYGEQDREHVALWRALGDRGYSGHWVCVLGTLQHI